VLDAADAPVPAAAITVTDPSGRQVARARADAADGGYAVELPAAGGYVLIATAPGRTPQAANLTVADGAPTGWDFRLDVIGGALTGTVRAAVSGAPVAGALVVATDEYGRVLASATSVADGGYRLDGVPAGGRHTLAVSAPGHRPAALPVEVATGRSTVADAELAPTAAVRGTVRGTDGRPLADALVVLRDASGSTLHTFRTAEDGGYRFADLDESAYTLVASGYPAVEVPVALTGRDRTELDLMLAHQD
jgi:hypothetical protein